MLKELMEYELRSFDDFVRDYATLYKSIDKACTELVDIGFYLNDRFFQKTNFPAYGEMILTINEWLVSSNLRFILRDYDQGMSLLRMAAEESRDLCVLLNEPYAFFLWKKYRTNRNSLDIEDQKKFRKIFRFDEGLKNGIEVKNLYDHASEYGIHGSGIFTNLYKKLPPSRAHIRLSEPLRGLTYIPMLIRDSIQPFLYGHADFIESDFGGTFDDFIIDLDIRYAIVSTNSLLAFQELNSFLKS